MIKCISFSKSLKQLFIISLISCFTLLVGSSVNAWDSYGDYGSTVSCNLYLDDVGEINGFTEGYNVNITSLGNFRTYSDLGNNNIFYSYSANNRRLWSWINGKLYINSYWYYSTVEPASKLQGFIDKIKVVDSSCLSDYSCVSQFNDYSNGTIITNEEFSNMNLTFTKYGVFATNGQSNNCSLNPSFIFGGLVFLATDGNFYSVACEGGREYPFYCPSGIITGSSLGLDSDLNYENLLNYTFSTSPFSSSGNGTGMYGTGTTGPTTGNINLGLTGDYTYYNCTYGVIIDYAENMGMSKNLCYGGLDNFDLYNSESTYNPVPGTGKTLGQITTYLYNTWSTPNEWFNFWNGLRGGYTSIWESYPAVNKTRFDLYYQYNGNSFDFDTVYEYCLLRVSDVDFANTVYKGQYFGKTCEYIKRNYGDNLYTSGNVVVGINWNGVGDLSGNKISDPVVYIQDFFNLLKENLGTRTDSGVGGIPSYIILFLLAIILFRFIKGK